MSHTEAQQRGPTHSLCQQEPHGCGDKVCQYRERTLSHHLCLPVFQHLSAWKELCSREQPQAIGDDSHEEPCQCTTMSSEDAAGATEIQCHHQVPPREPNATSGCTEPLPELLPVCDVLVLKGLLFALKSDFLSIEATCLLTLGALLPHSTFTKPNQYDAAWLISILGMSVFIT